MYSYSLTLYSDLVLPDTSVVISAELSGYLDLSEHDTLAPERSAGMLVVIVDVNGDNDVTINLYSTPVRPRLWMEISSVGPSRVNITLLTS